MSTLVDFHPFKVRIVALLGYLPSLAYLKADECSDDRLWICDFVEMAVCL